MRLRQILNVRFILLINVECSNNIKLHLKKNDQPKKKGNKLWGKQGVD